MNIKRYLIAAVAVLAGLGLAEAHSVDSIAVKSAAMNSEIKTVVVSPDGAKGGDKHFPVLYLLHGHNGNEKTWLGIRPDLGELAEQYGMIIVCPEGRNSWYWDSPVDSTLRYETFMTRELPAYIDGAYSTVAGPEGRAVTGLSMGGHGGLFLGIRHPEVFGACGSTSGGVDIRPFPTYWNMRDRLGEERDNPEVWAAHTVMTQLQKVKPGQAIIFDCGTSDVFTEVNDRLHREMLYMNIPHEYISRPGGHNAPYWHNSIESQLQFFDRFFRQGNKK